MPDSNSIRSTPPAARDATPRWTVITTPPSVAERWAIRSLASGGEGVVIVLALWLVFLVVNVVTSWSSAGSTALLVRACLFVLFAVSAWDRYAFGQLLERYDAELRSLQSRDEKH